MYVKEKLFLGMYVENPRLGGREGGGGRGGGQAKKLGEIFTVPSFLFFLSRFLLF